MKKNIGLHISIILFLFLGYFAFADTPQLNNEKKDLEENKIIFTEFFVCHIMI